MKNKISIIIPIYNSSKYLEELLDSISIQSYENFEVLMINDGSTDNSEKICFKFEKKDERFKYYYKNNSGVSDTRNFGIEKATGEYICFVDSDDLLDINYLNDLITVITTNNADLCCCTIEKFKNNQPINLNSECFKGKIEIYKNIDKYETLYKKFSWYACNRMFSTKIINEHNIKFKADVKMGEDLLFSYEYLDYSNKVVCFDKKNYKYRMINTSSSKNLKNMNWFSVFKAFEKILKQKEKYSISIYNKIAYSYCYYIHQAKYRMHFFKNKDDKKEIKDIIKEKKNYLSKISPYFNLKQKIKLFFYNHFNYLAFTVKLYKNKF